MRTHIKQDVESRLLLFQQETHDFLRLSKEPFQLVEDARVHRMLTAKPVHYLRSLEIALAAIARSEASIELPVKQLFEDPLAGSDFRVMPCVFRQGERVFKTVKIVGTNIQRQLLPQITVGKALVVDASENYISHCFDACVLSSARTGAVVTLAVKQLARNKTDVTIVGAGRVGFYSAFYLSFLPGICRIYLKDKEHARAMQAAKLLNQYNPNVNFEVCTGKELGAVLVLATDSKHALVDVDNLSASLVVSVGADSDHQRELDDSLATKAKLYVDCRDTANFGDLKRWINAGLIKTGQLTDLIQLFAGHRTRKKQEQSLFISTGSALFDNLTMAYLVTEMA